MNRLKFYNISVKHILILFLSLNSFILVSQNIDSLKEILKKEVHDTTRLRALCVLSEFAPDGEWEAFNTKMHDLAEKKLSESNSKELEKKYNCFLGYAYNNMAYIAQTQGDIQKANSYYFKALDIFIKNDRTSNIAGAYNNIGSIYNDQNDFVNAIKYFKLCIETANKIGDKVNSSHAYNNLGVLFYRMGNIPLAIDYFYSNAKVMEQIGDLNALASTYNNIAQILVNSGDTLKGLEFMKKALKMREKDGHKEQLAILLNNLAGVYAGKGKMDSSLMYFDRSLALKESIKDRQGIALTNMNIGKIYMNQNNFQKAHEYNKKALDILKHIEDNKNLGSALLVEGTILLRETKLKEAEVSTEAAIKLGKELLDADLIKYCAAQLFLIYKKTGKFDKALQMHELYTRMTDSLNNQVTKKSILKKQLSYDYEKKAIADSVQVVEERKVNEIKLTQEKTQKYALYVGLFLVLVFAFFMYNRFKITARQKKIIELQKHIVEEKNKEITDSINYAQKIQKTLLASQTLLNNNLQNYFVFFNPKDIVSGDFYWATNAHNKFYLAIADSTGHGVPGAFMSLLNISFLNEAINEKGLKHTNEILNHARQRLIQSLASESNEGGNDGMDCSLLSLDLKKMKLEFSCANNPILIIRNNEIIEHNVDKMPVGKSPKSEISFSKQEFDLQKDDIVYAFTDGFSDQFGGPKGKKFKYKQLCQMLLNNSLSDLKLQQELLQKSFSVWKGNLEQIDDVLVFGIKI